MSDDPLDEFGFPVTSAEQAVKRYRPPRTLRPIVNDPTYEPDEYQIRLIKQAEIRSETGREERINDE